MNSLYDMESYMGSLSLHPTLEEFTRFRDLPTEIRLKIWTEACFIPRIVDIWFKALTDHCTWEYHRRTQAGTSCYATLSRCSVLAVNQEARSVGLKYYQVEFNTIHYGEDDSLEITTETRPNIYINWACDIVCPMGFVPPTSFTQSHRGGYMHPAALTRDCRFQVPRLALNFAPSNLAMYVSHIVLNPDGYDHAQEGIFVYFSKQCPEFSKLKGRSIEFCNIEASSQYNSFEISMSLNCITEEVDRMHKYWGTKPPRIFKSSSLQDYQNWVPPSVELVELTVANVVTHVSEKI